MSDLYMPIEGRREVIKTYAEYYNLRIFVETGTADGSTTAALVPFFDRLFTIEIDPGMYHAAAQQFASEQKVICILGDSGVQLPELMPRLIGPALFWLDGHYCGGPTRGEEDSPVVTELATLWTQAPKGSVILIDDARIFGGGPAEGGDNGEGYTGYPALEWIEVTAALFGYSYRLESDIIRLTPSVQDH